MSGWLTRTKTPLKTIARKIRKPTDPPSPNAYATTIAHSPMTVKTSSCTAGNLRDLR
jgi:hypothetical protein